MTHTDRQAGETQRERERSSGFTSGDEERLRGMEVDAPDGPVVLVEAVEEGAHPVVPHLDDAAVEARQDPWPPRVEGQALDPVALGLELGEHLPSSPGDDQSAGGVGREEDLISAVAAWRRRRTRCWIWRGETERGGGRECRWTREAAEGVDLAPRGRGDLTGRDLLGREGA
jgi:hypothetical protein